MVGNGQLFDITSLIWLILIGQKLDIILKHFDYFCFSASVLDRLNAVLEPDGVLSINERGAIDGEIPSIKPHPKFR